MHLWKAYFFSEFKFYSHRNCTPENTSKRNYFKGKEITVQKSRESVSDFED